MKVKVVVPNKTCSLCGRKVILNKPRTVRTQELRKSRGGRPGLPVPNKPYDICGRTMNSQSSGASGENVEVAVLGSPSQIIWSLWT